MISDKSQGSVAARSRCDGLFSYHLTMYLSLRLVVKVILKSAKLHVKVKVDCLACPVRLAVFCLKMKNWPDNLPMMNINCICSCYFAMQIVFDFLSTNMKLTRIFLQLFLSG